MVSKFWAAKMAVEAGRKCEQLYRLRIGLIAATEVEPDQAVVERETLGVELFPVALVAKRGCHDALKVTEVSDPPMAMRHQMLDAPTGAAASWARWSER